MLNITPIVCINKIDYDTEEAERIKLQYEQSSIKTFLTSAIDAECINRLKNAIGEGITCFTGQSAVGKSTLTNGLLGHEAFRTGGLSKKTERGKHTTRHTELVMFDTEKFLVDTPGFSLIEVPSLSPEDFKDLYYEYNDYIDKCRFNGCNHINEPVCGVKNAVECGELSKERYERYRQLFQEIEENWRKRYD
jgi:ribosome biogenesis GTPase